MKSKLIVLSDLWGIKKSNWIKYYLASLNSDFNIKYYDCCELGKVDTSDLKEEVIHSQFINNGIDVAVKKLIELETDQVNILAFSIGGTIAWKAGLNGLDINNFYAISSTRLRYETEKPSCKIKLLYGEKDNFKPNSDWFNKLNLTYEIMKNGDHQIYKNKNYLTEICNEIKTHYNQRA